MKPEQLNRALRLVKRAGEKFLIMDQDTDKMFALMDLEDYERILEMKHEPIEDYSEEEMLDKIDRDLQHWRLHRHDDFEEEIPVNPDKEALDFLKNSVEEEVEDEGAWLENESETGDFSLNKAKFYLEDEPEELPEIKSAPVAFSEEEIPTEEPSIKPLKNEFNNINSEEPLDDLPEDEPNESGEEEKFYLEPIE